MNSTRKRKNKAFYVQANSKKKKCSESKSLDNGMKGFLITTNGNEGKAVSEAYSLLNEYADQPQGEEHLGGNMDAADALEEELAALKHTTKGSRHRFKSVSSGARGVLFIMCSPGTDPHGVVHNMFSDILQRHKKKARFCVRFLPVDLVCPAFLDDIKKHVPGALKEFHDPDVGAMKFGVAIKCRNNSSVVKEEVVSVVADAVTEGGKLPHKVDLSAPDRMVIVEIIQSHCCVSVVRDYFQFKKYNLQEAMTASTSPNLEPTAILGKLPTAQEEPLATQEVPSMTRGEPTATLSEPSMTQAEPSTTQREPSTIHKELSITQGFTTQGELSMTQREPAVTNSEPTMPQGESSSTHGEPSTTHGEPSTTHREPSMTHREPSATHGETFTTH